MLQQLILANTVANHISAMLAYWDKDLVCRFANDSYLSWFGESKEEMVNKMTLQELLGPTLYRQNLPYIEAVLKGKPQTFERQIPIPSGEGARYSLANYFPHIVEGEVKGFFAHVADITQIKLLEKELIESNETIKEQNKRLLSFANIVTHNLRSYANNLGVILDLFNNARNEAERYEMMGFLMDVSKGFSSTIDHLAEIVETQNRTSLKLAELNLHDYIKKAIDTIRIEIKETNALINDHVDQEITILANPAYLDSILLNLLTNSIKYRHPDRTPIIDLRASVKDKHLIFTICDNGLGIDLVKHKNNIFGMYRTFHGNPNAKGIGLFLVRSQVEAMGGYIKVESEVGKGTTFSVYFQV